MSASILLFFLLLLLVRSSALCPQGPDWRQSEYDPDKCYMIVMVKKTWFDAEIACKNSAPNAHLTSINSGFETANINAIVVDTPASSVCDQLWIGAGDFNDSGHFVWSDGQPFIYSNWLPGQPDEGEGECVFSQTKTTGPTERAGKWRMANCGSENCFICENYAKEISSTVSIPPTGTTEPPSTPVSSTVFIPQTDTTPSPRPTPPNPCINKNCNGTLGYPGTCSSDPLTCNCPGNLDPEDCNKVGCVSVADGGIYVTIVGPFWSPGYNGNTGTYGAGLECLWIMRPPIEGMTINVTAHYFKTLDNDGILTIRSSTGAPLTLSGDYENYMGILNTRLQNAVNGADTVVFTFRSTTAGVVGDYFDFGFSFVTSLVT